MDGVRKMGPGCADDGGVTSRRRVLTPGRSVLAAVAVVVALGVPTGPPAGAVRAAGVHVPHVTVPAGLPSHLAFGVAAEPPDLTGWMPASGVPWDYAYTYLAAGVNTGNGWETWNTAAQYPLWYAQSAAAHGEVPTFPYYMLLQSSGSCNGCAEAQRDLSNLNNAGLMASYFADYTMLMKRLGSGTWGGITGFGGTAIVQVEPDLSGYATQAVLDNGADCYGFCTGQGDNPALLGASVASSGDPDVASYPNTYQGFSQALAHLRDLYAPNVLLGYHVSCWAALFDVCSSTDPSLDVTGLAHTVASFADQAGVTQVPAGTHPYDLVFTDVADRDSTVSGIWWDQLNVTLPNFHRWESFVAAVTATTGKGVVLWQVPEGNQYFRTDDGSAWHRQDNRAQYFFEHPRELVAAGIVGVMFGSGGNGQSTQNTDAAGDGITNPPAQCTSLGVSSGQVCNSHVSTVSDDDGGYLRLAGAAYYADPVPLTGGGGGGGSGGYLEVASDGGIFAFGASFHGSMGGTPLNEPVVGLASSLPSAGVSGYWEVASDGGIFAFGDAGFHGSMGGTRLNEPVVGMASDPATGGYWEVAADGGIFAFGAPFEGSMGGRPLNAPIVAMAATADGGGYFEVASDGGIFAFGDARFQGSMGGTPLNMPVVGMAVDCPSGGVCGYWEVASDGGIFAFGAPFHGSMGGTPLDRPVVGLAVDSVTLGYWEVASDGGIFAFGAPFHGSMGGVPLDRPVVGMAASA